MSFDVRYRILKGISNMLCRMSYDRILSIGRFLGPCIMNRIAKQRNRGLEQIMTGLKVSRPEAEKLLIHIVRNMDNNILNTVPFHSRSPFDKYQSFYVMKISVCPPWK